MYVCVPPEPDSLAFVPPGVAEVFQLNKTSESSSPIPETASDTVTVTVLVFDQLVLEAGLTV